MDGLALTAKRVFNPFGFASALLFLKEKKQKNFMQNAYGIMRAKHNKQVIKNTVYKGQVGLYSKNAAERYF